LLAERLIALGLNSADGQAIVQSFEPSSLRRLAGVTGVLLVQVMGAGGAPDDFVGAGQGRTYADMITPAGLREISTYAQIVGAHKALVIARRPHGNRGDPAEL